MQLLVILIIVAVIFGLSAAGSVLLWIGIALGIGILIALFFGACGWIYAGLLYLDKDVRNILHEKHTKKED